MKGNAQIQTAKQSQRVNTQQIQFLNFLFLNQQELDIHVNKEMLENPFLEVQEGSDLQDGQSEKSERENDSSDEMRMDEMYSTDALENDEPYYKTSSPSSQENSEWKDLQMERQTEVEDITDVVIEQLKYKKMSKQEFKIAHFLVYSANEKGFLEGDISNLTDTIGFATGHFYEEEEITKVKGIVNSCEPIGYACFDLLDYMKTVVQLDYEIDEELKDATLKLLNNGFEELAKLKAGTLGAGCGIEEEPLHEVLELISKLKPYPTKGYGDWQVGNSNIIPDYQINLRDGVLTGEIISNSNYQLNVNEAYASSIKSTDINGTNSYISSKLKSAHWLIDAIQQREETMTKVIEAIVYLQAKHLVSGDNSDLRPMILKDVAQYIDMTIATVSRVTSNKFARTPIGLLNLKDLFSEAIELDSGERKSNREVQDLVVTLIENEDKANPLSDLDLRKALKMEGISLTRRTITKYRTAANIPSSKERKEATA